MLIQGLNDWIISNNSDGRIGYVKVTNLGNIKKNKLQ
jgi:hypothetical protein